MLQLLYVRKQQLLQIIAHVTGFSEHFHFHFDGKSNTSNQFMRVVKMTLFTGVMEHRGQIMFNVSCAVSRKTEFCVVVLFMTLAARLLFTGEVPLCSPLLLCIIFLLFIFIFV